MGVIKLTNDQWAREIEVALRKSEIERKRKFHLNLARILPVPIAIGIVASILLIIFYGWRDFFLRVLSATIAATIVATMLAMFATHFFEDD